MCPRLRSPYGLPGGLAVPVHQQPAQDLPRGRLGDLVDELDLAALHRLIDQGDDDALTAAAEVAAAHLADLGEMARQVARPGGHEAERVAPHKKVRQVEFIDEIPKAASGKILRRLLMDRDRQAAG